MMSKKGDGAREEALKWSVERLAALIDEIPIAVVNVDTKGKITYVNRDMLQRTGYLREDLVGKNGFRLGLFPRETLKVLGTRMKEKLMGKPPSPLEMQFKRKDGTWMWVETRGKALWEHGVPVGIQIVAQDITERKQAEEALRLFSHCVESSIDSMAMGDLNGKITYVNQAFVRMFGYSKEELIGKDIAFIYSEEQIPKLKEALKTTMEGGWTGELIGKRKNGGLFPIAVSSSRVVDDKENVIAIMANHRDITERRRMEKELREMQEELIRSEKLAAIGQLAGGIGHELRNPLGAIKNAVYYIKRKVAMSELAQKEPRVMEFLDIMDDEINASDKIISDLLGFSRVGKPSVSPTRIENVIEDALPHLTIPENIELTKELDADLPEVEIDAGQIRQVFINIIMNAVEAMPEGGRLTIGAKEKNSFLEVEIADTGCGIPQEAVGKIFDPLFTTKARGIGLGLTVCKAIIDRHQGVIEVESQVGKGTTFTVRLPLKTE